MRKSAIGFVVGVFALLVSGLQAPAQTQIPDPAFKGTEPPLVPFVQKFSATGQTTKARDDDDGDIRAGAVLSYTDNGDGTITDNNTGLVWEKKSADGSIHDKDTFYTWDNAFDVHVFGLNSGGGFAGFTDWRVPNVKELQSIVDYEVFSPALDPAFNTACAVACTVTTCSCTAASGYWSATTVANNPSFAWFVFFVNGDMLRVKKSVDFHVRGGL